MSLCLPPFVVQILAWLFAAGLGLSAFTHLLKTIERQWPGSKNHNARRMWGFLPLIAGALVFLVAMVAAFAVLDGVTCRPPAPSPADIERRLQELDDQIERYEDRKR